MLTTHLKRLGSDRSNNISELTIAGARLALDASKSALTPPRARPINSNPSENVAESCARSRYRTAELLMPDGDSAARSLCFRPHLKHNLKLQMDLLKAQEALLAVIRRTAAKIIETPSDQWTAGLVESRLNILEGYWRDFCDNHIQLLAAEEGAVADYLRGDGYSTAEDSYVQAQGLLFDHRARILPKSCNASCSSSEDALMTNISLARLPRITIPRFSGLQEDWEQFRDLFIDLIHNNAGLGDATKLLFLKTNVDGAAADALQDYKITENEYASAWDALRNRYDEPKLQVRDHLEALLSLRPLERESAGDLQILSDKLKRHRNQLEALEKPVQHWDDWFAYLASKVMDKTTRRIWEENLADEERTKGKADFSFNRLIDFLQHRCRTLKSMVGSQLAPLQSAEPRKGTMGPSTGARTIRTYATSAQHNRGCPACKEAHYIGHCMTFRGLDPKERRRLVGERNLCYNCLSSNHSVRNCPSQSTCRSCAGAHHTLIHEGAGKRSGVMEIEAREPKQARIQTAATNASAAD